MDLKYDVVIAGGGVMGSAVAYFLAADPAFDGSILVIEPDPGYARAATPRSWGGIRQQFSTPENVRMSLFGAAFARAAGTALAVDGAGPDLSFREQGYLFLASAEGRGVIEANHRIQQANGATVELLSPADLAARFPWLNTEGIAAAAFGPVNEGWIDPHALLQGLRRKARALGARYLARRVRGITLAGRRVVGVTLESGEAIACGQLVNAAGPQAGRVAGMAGVALPVEPRKRMSYVFDCRRDLSGAPLTIEPGGVAFRPEGGQYLAIVSPPEHEDGPCADLEDDYGPFERVIWPTLAYRVPAFEAIKLTRAWAGHYDYNSFDQNAILGPHPDIGGLFFCNGFSGHGIQQAPAAGRATAELIAHGRYLSLDLSRLGYARIAEGRAIKEANVV